MLHNEPITGGLVTSRDPAQLQPGELIDGTNWWYISNMEDLIVAPSFVTATLSGSSQCYGLAPAIFDNGNTYLTTLLSTKYQYATVSATDGTLGTWTDLGSAVASSSARSTFTSVHYNNKYYLLDGVQSNKVLRSDLTLREHGLAPVIEALPSVTSATATAAVWPANATGYFDYWYTEVMKLSGNPEDIVIESSYEATTTDSNLNTPASLGQNVQGPNGEAAKIVVASIQVTALSTQVTIKVPLNPRNTSATHYRLYRSEAKPASSDASFPIGELVAEVKIPGSTSAGVDEQYLTIIDGLASTSAYFYPSSIATATGWTATANGVDGSGHYSDNTFMTKSVSLPAIGGSNTAIFSVKTFNAGAAVTADPVSALEVRVQGKIVASVGSLNAASVRAKVSFDGGVSWSSYVSMGELSSTNAELTSGMRNWGRTSMSREDLLDANFYVQVEVTMTSRTSTPRTSTVSIDGVRVRANYNGTSDILTSPYPGIVISVGKQSYVCSRNGQPPTAKVGCIFQGSLVTDDTGAPSNLRWSIPGDPEAFPTLYYLPIETPNNDQITYIGMVNNVCIVGLQNSIVRLNYLPSEDDATFTRTRIYDFVSKSLGIVNAKAATTFLSPEGRELLACVTQDGIYVTDGFTISKWDLDYTFARTVYSENSVTPYNPLRLNIINEGSTGNLMIGYFSSTPRILPASFAARHLKPGPRLKFGLTFTNLSSATVGMASVAFTNSSGKPLMYYAFNSTGSSTIAKHADLGAAFYTAAGSATFTTRSMQFVEGFDEVFVNGIYLHGLSLTSTTVQATSRLIDATSTQSSSTITFPGSTITKADIGLHGYQTFFLFTAPGSTLTRISRFVVDYNT